jgi:hypothetical protein
MLAAMTASTRVEETNLDGQFKFAISLTANPIDVIPVANPVRTRRAANG